MNTLDEEKPDIIRRIVMVLHEDECLDAKQLEREVREFAARVELYMACAKSKRAECAGAA